MRARRFLERGNNLVTRGDGDRRNQSCESRTEENKTHSKGHDGPVDVDGFDAAYVLPCTYKPLNYGLRQEEASRPASGGQNQAFRQMLTK